MSCAQPRTIETPGYRRPDYSEADVTAVAEEVDETELNLGYRNYRMFRDQARVADMTRHHLKSRLRRKRQVWRNRRKIPA